jgi:hypothetical protein
MDIVDSYKQDKIYYISCRIKALNGKINSAGTDEDLGENLEDIQAQIQALTNMLEML